MSERGSDENARSRRLPPLEAWKKPDKWIDLRSGLVKPSISQLVLDTDERGFLDTDQVVEQVEDMLFWKDYDWPFSRNDPQTAPDDHHFYHTEADYSLARNNGNPIPSLFRELPTVVGRMPRQFHNAIHDFTAKPEMPDLDAMEEYHNSYQLAHRAFKSLMVSATMTTQASRRFTEHQHAVSNRDDTLIDPDDIVAQEMMKDFFSKHFAEYSRSVDLVMSLPQRSLIIPESEKLNQYKPHVVIKKVGKYMLQKSINYTPILRAA